MEHELFPVLRVRGIAADPPDERKRG